MPACGCYDREMAGPLADRDGREERKGNARLRQRRPEVLTEVVGVFDADR
jgi:hypothetical protein